MPRKANGTKLRRSPEELTEMPHGKLNTYMCGCRCPDCVAVNSERARRARNGGTRSAETPAFGIHKGGPAARHIRTDQLGVTFISANGSFGAVEHDTLTLEQYRRARG